MKRIGVVTSLVALTLAAPAQAQQAAPAAAQWNIIVDLGQCTLERAFTAPIPATLSIRILPGADAYRIAIAGKTLPKSSLGYGKPAMIIFHGADSRFQRRAMLTRTGGQFGNALIFPYLDRDVIDGFAKASAISFDYGAPGVGQFAIPRARAAIKQLDGCVRDQLVEWGANPAQFEPGGKTPVALKDRDDWVPKAALLRMIRREQDNLQAAFRVGVSPEGTIDSCELIGSSDLDPKPACEAIHGQHLFTPATDPAGKPVRGVAAFEVKMSIRPGGPR